jgi:hypothetical protein
MTTTTTTTYVLNHTVLIATDDLLARLRLFGLLVDLTVGSYNKAYAPTPYLRFPSSAYLGWLRIVESSWYELLRNFGGMYPGEQRKAPALATSILRCVGNSGPFRNGIMGTMTSPIDGGFTFPS